MAFKIAAFADEASASLYGQIKAMKENNVDYLEIRGVDEENIADISSEKAREIKRRLADNGLAVWSIGSPFGKIGIDDDLILLGGDSICAMNLLVECKSLPLSVPLIFEKRTIRAIAEAVEALKAQNSPTVQGENRLTKVPLNDIQLYMLRCDLEFPGTMMYNITYKIILSDNVNLNQFAGAVRKVLSAHPALLSVIEKEDGTYYLRYEPSFDKEIPVETMSVDEFSEVEKHFIRPFKLDGSPLCRTRIIRTPEQSVFRSSRATSY